MQVCVYLAADLLESRIRQGERDTERNLVFDLSHPKAEFELRFDFYLLGTVANDFFYSTLSKSNQ